MQERRDKGLCFIYDKKYQRLNKCPGKFLMLISADEEDPDEGEEVQTIEQNEITVSGDISSLNSLFGQGNPRYLRVWGNLRGQPCLVLIDGEVTHNFIL